MSHTPDPALATKVARAELMKRVLIVVTAVMVAAVLVLLVVLIGRVRGTQVDNTVKADKRDEVLAAIKDCTELSGDCYQRSQARTAEVVGDIGRYIVLASACAADVSATMPVDERIADITKCVTKRLAD